MPFWCHFWCHPDVFTIKPLQNSCNKVFFRFPTTFFLRPCRHLLVFFLVGPSAHNFRIRPDNRPKARGICKELALWIARLLWPGQTGPRHVKRIKFEGPIYDFMGSQCYLKFNSSLKELLSFECCSKVQLITFINFHLHFNLNLQ